MPRRPVTPIAAAACAGAAAWCSIGALGIGDGASEARLALLPSFWLLAVLVVSCTALAWRTGLASRTARPLFISSALILPWLPGPLPPAFLVWTGPVTVLVWAAVLMGVIAARPSRPAWGRLADPKWAPYLAAVVACALYLAGAARLSGVLPGGDEPHYLVIAQSLLRDRDLQIENNHRRGDYLEYFRGQLKPDYLTRGRNGQIYSIHAPGLPALVAPAYALFGYPGVVLFLSAVAGVAAGLLWRACYLLTGNVPAAWFGWASGALTVPFFFQAFQVFPDGVAAALVLFASWPLISERLPEGRSQWLLNGAALAFLPWLHTRYVVIACALGLCVVLRLASSSRRWRDGALFVSVPVISATGWFGYFQLIYGTFNPSAPYGRYTQSSLGNIPAGLPALLFDQQFGAIANAPVYGFCLIGLVALARRRPRLALEFTIVGASYLLTVAAYHMWWAGHSTPARFAVPVLLLLVLPGAWLWREARLMATRAVGLGALVVSVFMTAALAIPSGGSLAFNDRDGFAQVLEWLNPVIDLPRGLPSFFRQSPGGALVRAAVWILAFAAAWLVLRALERRFASRSASGALTLAVPVSLGIAGMLALTAVWKLDQVNAFTPETSQLDLLRHYQRRLRPVGADFREAALMTADELLLRLRISTSPRRGQPPDRSLLMAPAVPAGSYRLLVSGEVSSERLRLLIGPASQPLWTWDLGNGLPERAPEFTLPVAAGSVLIYGDGTPPGATTRIELQPLRITPSTGIASAGSARRAARYGQTLTFFLDDSAYMEPGGFWVATGALARVVAQPETGSRSARLFLRNSPVQNTLVVRVGSERQVIPLAPREERMLDARWTGPGLATSMEFRSERGFTPALSEPGSADYRPLGCWIEIRDQP